MGYKFNETTLEMRIPSIFSLVGTVSVMLTYYHFPKLRGLRYAQIVFYIAINDFIASIGTAMGPETNVAECWYQGLATNYNYLVAIFWTNVIVHQLYTIVVKNEESAKSLAAYHAVCWGFPLIVTLLPLTTNTYGEADDSAGWCFIAEREGSPSYGVLLWVILSFYIWVWMSILYILIVFLITGYHMYQLDQVPQAVYNVYFKLGLYPLALIICWLPSSLDDTMAAVVGEYSNFPGANILNTMANVLPPLQGFMLSIIFFGSNPSIRMLWYNYFTTGRYGGGGGAGSDTLGRGNELVSGRDKRSSMGASHKFSEATDFGINASLISWDDDRGESMDSRLDSARCSVEMKT